MNRGVESTVAQHRPAVELKLVEDPVDFVQREVLLAFEDSLDDSIDLGRIDVPVEVERQETNVLPAVVRLANRGREEVFLLALEGVRLDIEHNLDPRRRVDGQQPHIVLLTSGLTEAQSGACHSRHDKRQASGFCRA